MGQGGGKAPQAMPLSYQGHKEPACKPACQKPSLPALPALPVRASNSAAEWAVCSQGQRVHTVQATHVLMAVAAFFCVLCPGARQAFDWGTPQQHRPSRHTHV